MSSDVNRWSDSKERPQTITGGIWDASSYHIHTEQYYYFSILFVFFLNFIHFLIVVAHISLFIALYIAVCLFLYHVLCYLVLMPQDWINTTTIIILNKNKIRWTWLLLLRSNRLEHSSIRPSWHYWYEYIPKTTQECTFWSCLQLTIAAAPGRVV